MRPASRAWTRRAAAGILLAAVAIGSGCGPHHVSPPPGPGAAPGKPAGASRPKPGYDGRVDDIAAVDSSALAGKRIVLDPGHGGSFRGALGVNGLTEAEVNLGVALFLRGLLESRGVQVLMTRTDDRDYLTPADSTLRGDLTARMRLANAFHPDLFLSIHHNADARGAHDVNETQTYYKLGDNGPSLDAAQDVHRALVRNLGIETHRLLPGNYFVLRNCESPGLLTEASYLTNPDVEARLALAAKERLEAEALLIGLGHFFARRTPAVESFVASRARGGPADSVFDEIPAPFVAARITGAFDEAVLTLDGESRPGARRGQELEWTLGPLPAGKHEARLAVRLAGEGAAREESLTFAIRRRPAQLVASTLEPARWGAGWIVPVKVRIEDGEGFPLRDSLVLRLTTARGSGIAPAETLLTAADGVAWGYLRCSSKPAQAGASSHATVALAARQEGHAGAHAAAAAVFDPRRAARAATRGAWAGMALAMPDGAPLANAPGTEGPEPAVRWINRDGFAALLPGPGGRLTVPALPGYRAWGADSVQPPRLVAIAGGALHGRRIALDPDGGGDQDGGVGRSGTRAATLNLEVARALAAMLGAAGARVTLTRDGDYALSDVERVEKSERFFAERFLRIGHRAETPMMGHYFSSAAGKAWAARTTEAFARLALPAPAPAEDAQYPLQQTSCPALYASPARVDVASEEQRLLAPGTLRAEACALFLALAREWAPNADWPPDSLEIHDAAGRPLAGAAVTLGGALVLESDALGRIRFARTEPGPIEVVVRDPRAATRALLLDSDRGIVLTGPFGR
jgi:N-acetylmuramoyl-L-alanine amidase